MTDTAISVRNISKCYKVFDDQRARLLNSIWSKHTAGMQEVWALRDINFEIKRGEAVAIIGRNGGGKSTLLEILTGTLTPTSGQVSVNGRVSALLELGSGFNPEYSGRDNVLLNGLLLGLKKEDILERFSEIEEFAEIGTAIDRPVKTYSSGMMMRLAFAVQVLCDPDILIIDEALSVGDFFFQQKCLAYIKKLCKRGVTLLFVSHDMGTIRDLCPRVIYLSESSVKFDGLGIEGISKFFNDKSKHQISNIKKTAEKNNKPAIAAKDPNSIKKIKEDSIWIRNGKEENGKLIAIAIYDTNRLPSTSFKLGEEMSVQVLFKSDKNFENHIALAIVDKFGAIRSATGSLLLRIPGVNEEILAIFEINIKLMIEAAEYSLIVNLGYELEKNRGCILDETPMIGPINITWDYEVETAPFLGQVGLPVEAKFLN